MRPSPAALPTADAALALIKPRVRALAAYTLQAPEARRKLNQNESPFDVPAAIKDAVWARVRDAAWNRYPSFTPVELLARLAERHGWTPDGVLVGNGSNELIQATLAVTVAEGSVVVTPVPTFTLYRLLSEVYGGRHVGVPFSADFAFDIPALIRAAVTAAARVVVVNSPNNPTGTPLPEGAVERLLRETEALIVVDEAYQDFGGPTAIPLLAGHARLVVLRTFSKAMSLAGLRFGYALAHPAVAREIAKAKLPYNVNRVTLTAAHAALDAQAAFAESTARVRDARAGGGARHPGEGRLGRAGAGRVPARHRGDGGRCGRRGGRPHGGLGRRERPVSRRGEARRKTKETEVRVVVDLDGSGRAEIKTGIGFFDHMLEALARHAPYDLEIAASGDLHVDAHHTVEDVGIVLGQALSQALGERRGIRRYGDATVPLDDALARVVVDVSGRPFVAFHADPPTWQRLGDYDVALTPEFFRALATHGGLTLHVDLLRGQNAHHVVEAVFKAAARALGEATGVDPRVQGVPSTKGTLA